ncbi:hypothetical protein ACIQVO_18475 [Streptomyces sp. NPDC101062]|uniref:hypothetical protein n=1 Tax=unclassified Streptomyces TaxID=2593676 RepID=UPI002E790D79|nr:hypothetical protein [Streptomyces sp. JV176]MEE1802578.1 hypothetical protein [Streptomyces sp. JV176]
MNNNTPVSPRPFPLSQLSADVRTRVLSSAQLREYGVPAGRVTARCRAGGPWQQLLPGVVLLHSGPPTAEERLQAVLLYAGRPTATGSGGLPVQPGPDSPPPAPVAVPYSTVMVTGLAALSLYGFSSAPPLLALERIDVLVPRTRRLRSTGYARLIRAHVLPLPELIDGRPVAPVARAVADAVAHLSDAPSVVEVLTEAVRSGHCDPATVVRELSQSGLLSRQHVVDAVDTLLAEGRSLAEGRLYELVRSYGLPEPVWNVDLRLPGGPHLGGVDAYWPERAVAIELDTRAPRPGGRADAGPDLSDDEQWSATVRKREHLELLGITVVHLTPRKLRESLEQQATVVRTALMAADDRDPAARVVVLPR